MAGLTPDQKALFLAQEKKAAEGNAAIDRAKQLEARLEEIQRQQYQPQNPLAETVTALSERARFGDVDATAQLQVLGTVAAQQAELNLRDAMDDADVPKNLRGTVKALVRQSGYRMDVPTATELARGKEAPVLQNELDRVREENRKLREAIDGKGANGSPPKVSMSTPAAATEAQFAEEMTVEEYQAIMAQGGERALALRNSGVRFKR